MCRIVLYRLTDRYTKNPVPVAKFVCYLKGVGHVLKCGGTHCLVLCKSMKKIQCHPKNGTKKERKFSINKPK